MEEKSKRNKGIDNLVYLGKIVLLSLAIIFVMKFFLLPTVISGPSMENTLQNHDYIFVSAQSYKFLKGTPEYGDIIVFPVVRKDGEIVPGKGKNQENYIKRVIGLPGDIITIKDGKVYINGKKKNETYIKDGVTDGGIADYKVPKDQVFVMGDNRLNSEDSRMIGTVPIEIIRGKAIVRIYPHPKKF